MKTIMISPVGAIQSLTSISLAVIESLKQQGLKVGFVKPISQGDDATILAVKTHFDRTAPHPISTHHVTTLINNNRYDDILEEVVGKVDEASRDVDIVVIEGLIPSADNPFMNALNIDISRTLCSGIIFAGNAGNDTPANIAHYLDLYGRLYQRSCTWFAGYLLNRLTDTLNPTSIADACMTVEGKALECLGMIPEDGALKNREAIYTYIANHMSLISLIERAQEERSDRLPPSAFRYGLIKKAREGNKRIVLPEGDEPRTLKAAIICAERHIANCVLLGNKAAILAVAEKEGLTLPETGIEIIDPIEVAEKYVTGFVKRREHKGATEASAREALKDSVVVGTMMLAEGDVDGLVSGAVHTTADTIRPALQLIGTDKHSSIVSSIFFMLMPDQVHVYGDCAVNPTPTPHQLADIAVQSADSAKAFGIDPKVALISYSTGVSGAGPAVEAVAEATKLAKAKAPHFAIDGPLQFDAACVPSVGKQKAPNSPVAGEATVFIFPDLNTGNTTYKAVQRSANVVSIGPMLQGLAKPVNDLSRGALVDDIVYTIAITAIQAIAHATEN